MINKRLLKVVSVILIISLINSTISPTALFALTSGASSPEFSSYEPVATTDMVDIFSGDFNYNLPVISIPGPDGGGYSLSLSYHSGVSPEEEASWVGLGWTLNPGAINRGKIGLPDDFNGDNVIKYNKAKPTWSSSGKSNTHVEIYSKDKSKDESAANDKAKEAWNKLKEKKQETNSDWGKNANKESVVSVNLSKSIRFNNYKGYMKTFGFGAGVKDIGSFSLNRSSQGFNISANPEILMKWLHKKLKTDKLLKKFNNSKIGKLNTKINRIGAKAGINMGRARGAAKNTISAYTTNLITGFHSPSSSPEYKGVTFNTDLGLNVFGFLPIGIEQGYHTNFNLRVNKAKNNYNAYGYLYNPNYQTYDSEHILSDYYVEKEINYDKKDKYLGIPHQGADNFIATGEQISGGFSLYQQYVNQYHPSRVSSKQKIRHAGFELGVGPGVISTGFNFGGGKQENKIRTWKDLDINKLNNAFPAYDIRNVDYSANSFFRFSNDMGGELSYTDPANSSDKVLTSKIERRNFKDGPVFDEYRSQLKDSLGHVNRSSFIGYHTVKQIKDDPSIRFEKSSKIDSLLNIDLIENIDDRIIEYSVTNESGINYVYGLPVFTKNNKNLTIDASYKKTEVEDRYLAYKELHTGDNIFQNRVVIGEEIKDPYAVCYLLTQIVTPDYVDVGNNGPDENDFGGWTKFDYRKWKSQDDSLWYHFRAPYNGLLYDENQVSTDYDDLASVSSGDKQMYYLKAIETKSHVAFFITNETTSEDFISYTGTEIEKLNGSGEARYDQLGAPRETGNSDPAAKSKSLKDITQQVEKLERIVLYSKADFSKPVSTVNFDYEYALCGNLPNSVNSRDNNGKLTLKKVWFESEGVVNSRIAPYQFEYQYPQSYDDQIAEKYPEIASFATGLDAGDQNPDYEPYALDMWGDYQYNGEDRYNQRIPWVYQGNKVEEQFDPAAWNLKKIILPSGGEIHVQYEQKDYKYVQDKEALAMCSLLPSRAESYSADDNRYYLNVEDLGILEEELPEYLEKLKSYFLVSDTNPTPPMIYFKFLYSLPENKPADYRKCWMENISAYTNVNEIGIENGKIYFELGADRKWVTLFGKRLKAPNTTNVPRTVCYEYFVNNADGKLEGNDCDCDYGKLGQIDNSINTLYNDIIAHDDDFNYISNFKWRTKAAIPANTAITGKILKSQLAKKKVCQSIDFKRSFLRIPVFKSKKGGGIRVKRLLMYDEGMESGDAMVYGSEYIYETEDGYSSGVATNEPAQGREECALVHMLDEKNLKWFGNIMYGEDLKQSEGPLGENLLPAPSVGHSRVVVQNIHQGKTGTGHTIYTFNTVKDYPLSVEANTIEMTNLDDDHLKRKFFTIPAGFFNFTTDKMYATQGYKFTLKEFNGRPKMISSCTGDYISGAESMPISYTKYNYYDLSNEKLNYLLYDQETGQFSVRKAKPGKEERITSELKSVYDKTTDFKLELDLAFMAGVLASLSYSLNFTFNEYLMNSHVTSTVVRYPAIVKSVENFSDAGTVVTENLAFNPHNGKPVLTRTNDGFDNVRLEYQNGSSEHNGGYYSWNIPASWIYPELGPKSSVEEGYRTNQLSAMVASLVSYGEEGNWLENSGSISERKMKGVMSASATTFKNNWFAENDEVNEKYNIGNQYISSLNKNWYPSASYVYDSKDVSQANAADTGRIYNGGILQDFEMFSWADTSSNSSNWLKTEEITRMSPNGVVLEEKDILGIYSTAKYGYNNQLPVLVAKNADYTSVVFKDFENSNMSEATNSHSGERSLNLREFSGSPIISENDAISFSKQFASKGATAKLWLKSISNEDDLFTNQSSGLSININGFTFPMSKVASTGEWALYEANITEWPGGLSVGDKIIASLSYGFLPGEEVYIDDFKFHPLDAEVNCTVYDVRNYKVLTQFDNQHFGLFYQYNTEGQLVRKLVETERGMKTIQETQYNVETVARTTEVKE